MRLENKIAVVTGGAHGIGKAVAEIFAAEGAQVFIADLDRKAGEKVAADIRRKGGEATFIYCDVSSPSNAKRTIKKAAGKVGRIDVLCNNAAYITNKWHSAGEATDKEWEKSFRVSLLGTQYFT